MFGQPLETRFAHARSPITGVVGAAWLRYRRRDRHHDQDRQHRSRRRDLDLWRRAGRVSAPLSYGGQVGQADYLITVDLLHDRVGIENPTGSFDAIHDLGNQSHGIAHLSRVVDGDIRIGLPAGMSNEFFQIPDNPGQTPSLGLSVRGVSGADSTDFAILSLRKEIGVVSFRSVVFTRYGGLYYMPDPAGDLLFNGISQTAARSAPASRRSAGAPSRPPPPPSCRQPATPPRATRRSTSTKAKA